MHRLICGSLVMSLLICTSAPPVVAQTSNRDQRPGFFIAGALVNGATGGIGSLIQRREGERPGKAFWRGFGVGAAGGLLQQTGMAMTNLMYTQENLGYAWPATLVHAAGTSLIENATLGRAPLSHWHVNLYYARLDYDVPEKRFQARLLASSVVGSIVVGREARLNVGRSLATGTLYYDYFPERYLQQFEPDAKEGRAYATSVAVGVDESAWPRSKFYEISAHEHVHVLQYNGMVQANALLTPLSRRLRERSRAYNTAARFVYADLNGLVLLGCYHGLFGGKNQPCYWDNRLERVAEHYSNGVRPGCP